MRVLRIATVLAVVWLNADGALAQGYPARPITIVVPFPAGGPTYTLSRIIAERMRTSLGQPVLVESVTGAAGTIGVGRVARAAPDGYTLSLAPFNAHVLTAAIYKLSFDPLSDFEPIGLIATNDSIIVSRSDLGAKDLGELINWARTNPAKVSVGTGGIGSATHLGGILFEKLTGASVQFVAYRGIGPAMQDLMAKRIDLMFDQISSSLPQVQAGTIKAYAVMARHPVAAVPQVPSVDEAGLPEFYMPVWHGMWAPKGTPNEIIRQLNQALIEALADTTVRHRLADIGQEVLPRDQQTPEALQVYQTAEAHKWWPIIKAAGVKAE